MSGSPYYNTMGRDLRSGPTLALGPDGDVFHVGAGAEPAAPITAISGRPAGFEVTLIFDDAMVIAHEGTGLILQGQANVIVLPGDVFKFVSEGGGAWRESSRRPAAAQGASVQTPTGTVVMYAGNAAPAGWLLCDGSLKLRDEFPALAAVLGDAYGLGDGVTFRLPNTAGRAAVGEGAVGADGTNVRLRGQVGGSETHRLTGAESPKHAHAVRARPMPGAGDAHLIWVENATLNGPDGTPYTLGPSKAHNLVAGAMTTYVDPDPNDPHPKGVLTTQWGGVIDAAGPALDNHLAHNNMQPFWVANFIIKT